MNRIESNSHTVWFDVLRVFAIIYVFFFHYNMHFHPAWDTRVSTLLSLGGGMMALLFMLSGCLLYMVYEVRPLNTASEAIIFYKKRLRRTMPLYLLYLGITVMDFLSHAGYDRKLLYLLPVEMSGTQALYTSLWDYWGNSGTWFISTILILYFLFPLLQMLVLQLKRTAPALLVLFLAASYPAVIEMQFGGAGYYTNPCFRVAEFTLGMVLGKYLSTALKKPCKKEWRLIYWLGTIAITVVFCLALLMLKSYLGEEYYRYNFIVLPYFSWLILGAKYFPPTSKSFPSIGKLISVCSGLTYAFYVMQPFANSIAMLKLSPFLDPSTTLWPITFLLNVLFAVISTALLRILQMQKKSARLYHR